MTVLWFVVQTEAMEHHWSNLNLNQAYGRLPTPANAGLNRFDLHLLEQQGFATAGLFAVFFAMCLVNDTFGIAL